MSLSFVWQQTPRIIHIAFGIHSIAQTKFIVSRTADCLRLALSRSGRHGTEQIRKSAKTGNRIGIQNDFHNTTNEKVELARDPDQGLESVLRTPPSLCLTKGRAASSGDSDAVG